jgi:hypothetical protein
MPRYVQRRRVEGVKVRSVDSGASVGTLGGGGERCGGEDAPVMRLEIRTPRTDGSVVGGWLRPLAAS